MTSHEFYRKRIFKGERHINTCPIGINMMVTYDLTVGIAGIESNVRSWVVDNIFPIIWKIQGWKKKMFPVKQVGRGRVIDIWQAKYGFTWDQGLREKHNMFVNMAERGKLNEVDDRECWERSKARYGRGRVNTGSRKDSNTRANRPIISGM
jgi:hypothetical protein